jgi:hypothetical protein
LAHVRAPEQELPVKVAGLNSVKINLRTHWAAAAAAAAAPAAPAADAMSRTGHNCPVGMHRSGGAALLQADQARCVYIASFVGCDK